MSLPGFLDMLRKNVDNLNPGLTPFTPIVKQPDIHPNENTYIKTVCHVFQKTYHNNSTNVACPGFGDFLRGSHALYQICKCNNWNLIIHITNHPYLHLYIGSSPKLATSDKIPLIPWSYGVSNLTKYIADYPESVVELGTNMFAKDNSVTTEFQTMMQTILQPTDLLKQALVVKANIPAKTYSVIHIRVDDQRKTTKDRVIAAFNNKIKPHIKENDNIYVISSDINIRDAVVSNYGYHVLSTTCATHLSIEDSHDGTLDTMVDFMFMSQAQSIYQLSFYGHGSGFSEWCAKIYNIPLYPFML
jgi:hypothetical protein